MARSDITKAIKQRKLSLLMTGAIVALALPSAGMALVDPDAQGLPFTTSGFDIFTPANVDPDLAARFANVAADDSMRFTPAGTSKIERERTVTVAVRIDEQTAKAISVRKAIDTVPRSGKAITALDTTRFNLGTARGYQTFARPVELPDNVRNLTVPDLSEFKPAGPRAEKKPSRLQPRIELEDEQVAGRSPNTLDSLGAQTVGVGGSFRLSPNLDVTAGVRYSQERERLAPLTNAQKDSQAVYVGTQIRF